jgi:hypothetical protein
MSRTMHAQNRRPMAEHAPHVIADDAGIKSLTMKHITSMVGKDATRLANCPMLASRSAKRESSGSPNCRSAQ